MKKLKKVVVQIPLDKRYKNFFDVIERFELLEIHRLNKDIIIATQFFKFKEQNFRPENLIGINGIEYLEILTENKIKNEFVCIGKHRWLEPLREFFKDPDLIMKTPIIMENNELTICYLVDVEKMEEFYSKFDHYGANFQILSVSNKICPNFENIYMLLTERQRHIMFYAVKNGYYEIPRKINSHELAEKFKISQSALSEHLRKIERIVFHSFVM